MRDKSLKDLTLSSLLIAIITIMTFIPQIGYISIPGTQISITTIHIVVLSVCWGLGLKQGIVVSLAFGLLSLLKAFMMPVSPSDIDFVNPFISVLPRFIFGLVACGSYYLINRFLKNKKRMIIGTIITPFLTLFHSFITMSAFYIVTTLIMHKYSDGYLTVIGVIFTVNGLIEMVASLFIVPPIAYAIMRAVGKMDKISKNDRKEDKIVENYNNLSKKYEKDLLNSIKQLVSINSVYDEKSVDENNPFGKGVTKALNYMYEKAKKDGFAAKKYDNKIVEITCGDGEKNITILGHVDVVPTGEGWEHDPFEVVEKDGVITGRGVSDDKGPLLASYYALKALKDNNMLGHYQVRILVGGNEENGSRGVYYYFNELKKYQPSVGFTPDSDFPLIFAEKGIINFKITKKVKIEGVNSLLGGQASNSVIDKFEIDINRVEELKKYLDQIQAKYNIAGEKITIEGKAAHGAFPQLGINAGVIGLKALSLLDKDNSALTELVSRLDDVYGRGIGCYHNSKTMGENSLNVGIIKYEKEQLSVTINFRYVELTNEEEVIKCINECFKDYDIEILEKSRLLNYPLDSILVKTLLKAYQDETNDLESKPIAIGGGTYAKEADNIVAFGAQFPNYDTYMHSNHERMNLKHLYKSMNIYMRAILYLGKAIDENKI